MDDENNLDGLDVIDVMVEIEDDIDSEDENAGGIPRRYIRDMENPFERNSDSEFIRRYKWLQL